MGFARFMSSTAGRLIRIVAGLALIIVGVVFVGGTLGTILAVVGLVPLLAGIVNVCVFAPLFGGPFQAKNIS
jgi:cobalamin biosynthesis protein CobD/CbiB